MPKIITPQMPGSVSADPKVDDVAAEPEDQAGDNEMVSVSKSQLNALMSRLDALESRPSAVRRENTEASLPDSSEIDLAALKSPVLTKQGWVVPEKFGSNPNAPK